MTKLYAQRKDVFDIDKITVVGSPTITSDGVASGFSDENYVTVNDIPILSTFNSWKIVCKVKILDNTGVQFICGKEGTLRLQIVNKKIDLRYVTANTTWANSNIHDTVNCEYGDIVFIKVEYTGSFIILSKSIDGEIWEVIGQREETSNLSRTLDYLYIGKNDVIASNFYQGQIDLTAFKIYVDGELVYSPTKPTYLLERRKPKVWNKGQFTIVGNPSISDDGVASGFSEANYIKYPYQSLGDNFEIIFPAFKVNDVTVNNSFLFCTSSHGLRVQLYNSKIRTLYFVGSDSYPKLAGTTTLQNNIEYLYKVVRNFDGTNYTVTAFLSSDNGTTWVQQSKITTDKPLFNNVEIGYLGGNPNMGTQVFTGSINLKQFKIYTDNNLVFDGGADTYVYDPSKFTVVGSPTITDDGIASGFSSINYITGISIDYSSLKSYEFHTKINSGDTPSNNSMFWGIQRVLYLYQNSNAKIIFMDAPSGATLSFVADRNTDYDIFCGHDENNLFYLKYKKVEEKNYTILSGTVNKRTTANGVLNIGCYSGGGYPLLTGSIDLSQFSIEVDGKEVFTGAKEQYYAMRGGM